MTPPREPRSAPASAPRTVLRWLVALVCLLHGLVHLLGAAAGLGWAAEGVPVPATTAIAVAWLVDAAALLVAGVLLAARVRWWWAVAGPAVLVSQALILTAWPAAWAGTIANVVIAVAVLHGWAVEGPRSLRADYRRRVRAALARLRTAPPAPVVTEADLAGLPAPVAAYVRAGGAVGRPRVLGFRATIHGRIRAGAAEPWMSWTGEQVNTYDGTGQRLFRMDATMRGLPADVLHTFVDDDARMRVRLAGVATVVAEGGADLARAETVTLLNDLCILAPAALVDAPITWRALDDRHAEATYTRGGTTVRAVLAFDAEHRLVDFVSDDRLRSLPGGGFTRQRWTTPVGAYRQLGDRVGATLGQACWHPGNGEPGLAYLEFAVDAIEYLAAPSADQRTVTVVPDAGPVPAVFTASTTKP